MDNQEPKIKDVLEVVNHLANKTDSILEIVQNNQNRIDSLEDKTVSIIEFIQNNQNRIDNLEWVTPKENNIHSEFC